MIKIHWKSKNVSEFLINTIIFIKNLGNIAIIFKNVDDLTQK